MALLKKLIRGRSRALPVGRGVPFRRPIRGRPTPPISIDRPPLTPSLGGAKPVQEGPLPLPVNPADDIVSALPVGPSIPFIPPLDTNELPTASPLPVPPPPPLPIGEQVPFIQQLIPENLRRGPFGNDSDRFRRPPPSLPPGGGRPLPPISIGGPKAPPGVLKPGGFTSVTKLPPPTPEEKARMDAFAASRAERDRLSKLRSAGVNAFFEAFPDAPQMPQMQTADRQIFKNPFTGEMQTGSSTQAGYLNRLKEYLDANPAAMESYQQNVLAFNTPPSDPGSIFGPVDPGRGIPQTPISIGGPGGLIPPPPDLGRPIQPQVPIPSEVFDKFGNVVAGPMGRTPPRFAEYQKSPIRESYADFIARTGGLDEGREDLVFAGGSPTFDERGEKFVPPPPPDPVPDPIPQPATDPTVTETTTDVTDPTVTETTTDVTDPAQTQITQGAIDPVLLNQQSSEVLGDPLLRSLYFGTADQPGFFNQLQQAGANLIGSDVPLQQTAGLSPLELLARQQAVAGLGGFEPFFQQNKGLIDEAIGQSRRAEALQDPYFRTAEDQMFAGLGDTLSGIGDARGLSLGATDAFGRRLSDVEARGEGAADRFGQRLGGIESGAIGATDVFGRSLGESEDLLRDTLGGYDQGFTQQFYNPFEDAVVQQTIDDVFEAGEQQDVAARAREIGSGAFGGSRARLGAKERREALGEGLAQALGNIRQRGFSEAQRAGLGEFARQQQARRLASQGLSGLAGTRFGAQSGLFDRLTSGAQQRLGAERGLVDLLGRTGQQQLTAQQQLAANLQGFGSAAGLARQNLAGGLLGIGQQRGAGAQQLAQSLAGFGQQIGGIGSQLDALRRGQRGELAGFGGIGRGIAETGLSRIFAQQMGQQQRPLNVLGAIAGMLPGYQGSRTQIDSQYGMPTDPTAAGLGAAFSAYGALAPRQGSN